MYEYVFKNSALQEFQLSTVDIRTIGAASEVVEKALLPKKSADE